MSNLTYKRKATFQPIVVTPPKTQEEVNRVLGRLIEEHNKQVAGHNANQEQLERVIGQLSGGSTTVNVGGSSGGGSVIPVPPSSNGVFKSGFQAFTGAGIQTISFAPMPTATYIVSAYGLAGANQSLIIPQIPPASADSRTVTSFQVQTFEDVTVYWSILYSV